MNFKQFNTSDNQWHDVPYYQHKTATDTLTLPAVIYPNANSITVGIKGQSSQASTPTPQNPVDVNGTGERTGNLWAGNVPRYAYAKDYKKYNPDNAVYIKAGTYTISTDGKLPNFQVFDDNHTQYSISEIMTFPSAYYPVWDGLSISPMSAAIHTATITILADCIITLTVVDNIGTYIMLNSGSTAKPFGPWGYKIPISSASTTTPVYLGEVQTTRRIRKLVLTGEEDYVVPNISLRVPIGIYVPAIPFVPLAVISSHFQTKNSSEGTQIDSHLYTTRLGQSGGIIWFFVPRDFFSGNLNVDNCEIEYKEWLRQQYAAGTPVTVWYVLATEETGIVNEPLMRIGDYADTLSGITIPTIAGANTLSIGTTLQPSEVSVNYKGWHPVADVHEYDSNYTIATMQALTIAQLQTYTISDLQGGEWS